VDYIHLDLFYSLGLLVEQEHIFSNPVVTTLTNITSYITGVV